MRALAWSTLRKLGSSTIRRQEALHEGDIVLRDGFGFCVLKKDPIVKRGSKIVLRELGTNFVQSAQYQPKARISVLVLPDGVPTPQGLWKVLPGDVVIYPGDPSKALVAAIRHRHGWHRTAAPWQPMTDAEILLDLQASRAILVRSHLAQGGKDPRAPFSPGAVAASRNLNLPEPSVWVRTAEDFWASNSRGAAVSDQMVRYELDRGTYQILQLPEGLA